MQLAVMIEGQDDVTWPQWRAIADTCEAHAIPTLFRSDHYVNLDGHLERGSLDAIGSLCGLAAVTTTLELGTLVSPVTFRHPSELAKLAVTADHISGGRFTLGLGAGWNELEHSSYGFDFPPLKSRMDILEEQLAIVRGNWAPAGEPFSFDGEHYTLRDLDARPKPVNGTLRLVMGGTAAPRGCRLAARYADEYNTTSVSDDVEIRARRERVEAACAKVGREPIPFSLMSSVVVGSDAAELDARAARIEQARGLPAGSLRREPGNAIVGTVEQVVARLRALGELGISRVFCRNMIPDDLEMIALLGDVVGPAVA